MNLEMMFRVVGQIALVGWILLVFFPRAKITKWIVHGFYLQVILALFYIGLMIAGWGSFQEGGFDTLANVQKLFMNPMTVLAGWIHYLVFDLFVGTWIARDWEALGKKPIYTVPALILTFLLGPVGFLIYWIQRRKFLRAS